AQREAFVLTRFIGATAGSTDGRTLLETLSRQIVREYGGWRRSFRATRSSSSRRPTTSRG
ncbi:MAG TPA: hypothetical protein VKT00_03885, partial [Casimicrobiaceae bacterium]|nr:hypothetical protein [Casimicrobiaceae bacterium]